MNQPQPIQVDFCIRGSFTYHPLLNEDLSELSNGVLYRPNTHPRPGLTEIQLGLGSSQGFSEEDLQGIGIQDLTITENYFSPKEPE